MKPQLRRSLVMLVAVALDLAAGDPPNRWHPVAWMGTAIAAASRRLAHRTPARALLSGAALMAAGEAGVLATASACERLLHSLPEPLALLLEALMLKMTIAPRGLALAALSIERALLSGDLAAARRLLAWHLVSRDTSDLSPSQVAAATIESVAENTSDGIVAPLLYYAAAGLRGALAYRFANTADAMLGYHDREREWLGKVPARLDDLLNLLPSRLTAALLLGAAAFRREGARQAWRILRRDHARTASPNAGYPMSAMAGALGLELEKLGHYRLGAGQAQAQPEDISRAVRLSATALGIGLLSFAAAAALWPRRRGHRGN